LERTAPIVIAERVTDLLALVILAGVGALVFPWGAPVALLGFFVVGFAVVVCVSRPVADAILRGTARLPVLNRMSQPLRTAFDSVHALSAPRPFAVASLLALLGWSLEVGATMVILRGFGIAPISWTGATVSYA